MAENSMLGRLAKLEAKRRFLDWFATERFYRTLTEHELTNFAVNGQLPTPIPNRPSTMDSLDKKALRRLWKEDERFFGGRNEDDLVFFTKNGFWPEQQGGFHYSMQDGKLIIEWITGQRTKDGR